MIVIDTDMPNNCDDCPMWNEDYRQCVINEITDGSDECRPNDCPIVIEISQADVKKIQDRDKAMNDFYNAFGYRRGD